MVLNSVSLKKCSWDPFIERIEKMLSTWKGKYLSLGSRITFSKLVLASIPSYFLSCFKCLAKVVWRIENIRRDFPME